MQSTESAALNHAARDRHLYRLVDVNALSAATAALSAAAAQARHDEGVLGRLLTSADAIVREGNDASRDHLREAVLSPAFATVLRSWMRELREVASAWPDSGACTLATALKLWSWTLEHFRAWGHVPAMNELIQTVCPLVASRCLVLSTVLDASESRLDLAHVYAAHAAALSGAACAELVFGYRDHLVWDAEGCATCYVSDDLDDLEAIIPGIASGARTNIDIIEADGSHPAKRGPCATFNGLETFMRLRNRLDACLTGARVAKDRAAVAIAGRA